VRNCLPVGVERGSSPEDCRVSATTTLSAQLFTQAAFDARATLIVVSSRAMVSEFPARVGDFLKALGASYTYSPRWNVYVIFGLLWGMPVPIFAMALHLMVAGLPATPEGLMAAYRAQPVHYLLLLHPLLFGIIFGALGTIRCKSADQVAELVTGLSDKVAERTAELAKVHMEALLALASTIEMKDPYTRGHCYRVARIGTAIADELGLDTGSRETLLAASYLHDIGKIWVSSSILGKTTRLTSEEFGQIRQHPEKGAAVLRTIARFDRVAEVVAQHHERVDGSGYPRGLAGERILLEAKVLMVADAVDALTSDRPYRPALPMDIAQQEIRRAAGLSYDAALLSQHLPGKGSTQQFDRVVVEAFCRAFERHSLPTLLAAAS